MLETLERGHEGRQWHTLMDKVFSPKTLHLALSAVCANRGAPGMDGQTTEVVAQRASQEVALIQRLLEEGTYEPRPAKRVWINKAGSRQKRPLGLPTVRDRIVEKSLHIILEPIFEKDFAPHSYGFRPGRKAQQAVARVDRLLEEGRVWVVDADIRGYFDNIPQDQLMTRVREKISDGRVLGLLEKLLQRGVMESGKDWESTPQGTPQGAVISPLLANVYLNALDHLAVAQAGLSLHPEKTKIVDARQPGGFEFLGWHFEQGWKWPRRKSQDQYKEAIRKQTRRSNGKSLQGIIAKINQTIRGWGNYFRGGARTIPTKLDKWTRARLRSILRKRDGRSGPGRGLDHRRYPDAYFAKQGLIFLKDITLETSASPGQ
jgi:RNA-directed DNA polymerase